MAKISYSPSVSGIKGRLCHVTFSELTRGRTSFAFFRRNRSTSGSAQTNAQKLADLCSYWNAQRSFLKNCWSRVPSWPDTAINRFIRANWNLTGAVAKLKVTDPSDLTLDPGPSPVEISIISNPYRLKARIPFGAGQDWKILFRYVYPYWGEGLYFQNEDDFWATLRVNSPPSKFQVWTLAYSPETNLPASHETFWQWPAI